MGEYMGKMSLRYFGPVVWETMLPAKFKLISDLDKFKEDIKEWIPSNCKCRLCKTYIAGLGFIEISEWFFWIDSSGIPKLAFRKLIHSKWSLVTKWVNPIGLFM